MNILKTTCPYCGGHLSLNDEQKQAYCPYCGGNIILGKENEHIIRHINEDEIIKASAAKEIELRKIELEAQKQRDLLTAEQESKTQKRQLITTGILAYIILILVGVVLSAFGNESGLIIITLALALGMFGLLGFMTHRQKKKESVNRSLGKIELTAEIVSKIGNANYTEIEAMLRNAGFTNVSSVNMGDLRTGILIRPGKVDAIIINGEEVHTARNWYYSDVPIMVRYHGFIGS